jgi:cell division initiation protein
MIDLTPLDVRNKRGDFKRGLRGYDSEEVDGFLELVAERLEELVRENLKLKERSDRLEEQVRSQEGREKAVNDALVTAQQLREEIQGEARSQADRLLENARAEASALLDRARADAEALNRDAKLTSERAQADGLRKLRDAREMLENLDRSRSRFLKAFKALLEREMDVVEVEEARGSLTIPALPFELGDEARMEEEEGPPPAVSTTMEKETAAPDETAASEEAAPAEEVAPAVEDASVDQEAPDDDSDDAEEEVHIRDLAPPTSGAWDASFLLKESEEGEEAEGEPRESDADAAAAEEPAHEEKRWIWTPPPAAMPSDVKSGDGGEAGLGEVQAGSEDDPHSSEDGSEHGSTDGPEEEDPDSRKPFWRRGSS